MLCFAFAVTNTQSDDTNALVVRINNITHQIGLGGVFHGGLVVDNHEWSFGYCDRGSGMYCCTPGKVPAWLHARKVRLKGSNAVLPMQNPSYKFRLKIDLGIAPKTKEQVQGNWGCFGMECMVLFFIPSLCYLLPTPATIHPDAAKI